MAFERLLKLAGMENIMKTIEKEEKNNIPITEGTRGEGIIPDPYAERRLREEAPAETEVPAAEETPAKEEAPAAEETPAKEEVPEATEEEKSEKTKAQKSEDALMKHFMKIASIPHGSGNTKALSDALVQFAMDHGYEYIQDEANNVIITAPATPGYENEPPIALQGHIDMVCAKMPGCEIDMENEAIRIVRDGDWMRAEGTTLGADNGIAVAMMLAILDDPEAVHPLLECIFTADEEIGLIGADALDLSDLKSRRLLNLDNEEEGVFCAGCAGGAEIHTFIPASLKKKKGLLYEVEISDLTGGHSGMLIGEGYANAIVLMARLLDTVNGIYPINLVSIEGGDADNAIPRHCRASFVVGALGGKDISEEEALAQKENGEGRLFLEEMMLAAAQEIAEEYSDTDPDLCWTITSPGSDALRQKVRAFGIGKTGKMIAYLLTMPTSVYRRFPGDSTRLQTSINAGVVRTDDEGMEVISLARSNVNSQNDMMIRRVESLAELAGGYAETVSQYPAWEYESHSPFRDKLVGIYRDLYSKDAKVEVIHAGLECGILADKVPGLECMSIGPDLMDVHTAQERMNIPSAQNVYEFVRTVLSTRDA